MKACTICDNTGKRNIRVYLHKSKSRETKVPLYREWKVRCECKRRIL